MRKTILTKDYYLLFYETYLFGDTSDPVECALKLAYRDMCRTLHGISKVKDKGSILITCRGVLREEINKFINANPKNINQEEVDKFIEHAFKRLIVYFDGCGIDFTIGQAQKWFNMTIKYISMLDYEKTKNIYEFCHVPIDNYIIKITKYDKLDVAWSRINNYNDYLEFQKWFRDKYKGIPLDEEFKLWINACKENRKNIKG